MGGKYETKIVITGEDRTGVFGKTRKGIDSISNSLERLKHQAAALTGINFGFQGLKDLVNVADDYQLLGARIGLVTDSQREQVQAQKAVAEISRETRSDLQATGQLYVGLGYGLKDLNVSQKDMLETTRLVAIANRISGGTTQEAASATRQLSQAMSKGTLDGDEFKSVMENSRRIAKALADGLGVTRGELRAMSEQGELTAERVYKALLSQKGQLEAEFKQLPVTVGEAFGVLSTSFSVYVGEANKARGATRSLADGVLFLADNFEEIADVAIPALGLLTSVMLGRGVSALTAMTAAQIKELAAAKASAIAAHQKAQAELKAAAAAVEITRADLVAARAMDKATGSMAQQKIMIEQLIIQERRLAGAKLASAEASSTLAATTTLSGRALGLLGGPVGVAVTAISTLALGYSLFSNNVDDAANSLKDYKARLLELRGDEEALAAHNLRKEIEELDKEIEGLAESLDKLDVGSEILSRSLPVGLNKLGEVYKALKDKLTGRAEEIENINKKLKEAVDLRDELQNKLDGKPITQKVEVSPEITRLNEEIESVTKDIEKLDELAHGTPSFWDVVFGDTSERTEAQRSLLDAKAALKELNQKLLERVAFEKKHTGDLEVEKANQLAAVKDSLDAQIDEYEKANKALKKAQEAREKIEENYKALEAKLTGPAPIDPKKATVLDLNALRRQAQSALDDDEDPEAALQKIKQAKEILGELAASEQATVQYVKAQLNLLKQLEIQARDANIAAEEKKQGKVLDGIKVKVAQIKQEFKNIKVDFDENSVVASGKKLLDEITKSLSSISVSPIQIPYVLVRSKGGDGTEVATPAPIQEYVEPLPIKRRWGGWIPGYGGGDRWPVLAEGGEHVTRKERAGRFGGLLHLINSGSESQVRDLQQALKIKGYRQGGLIDGIHRSIASTPDITRLVGGGASSGSSGRPINLYLDGKKYPVTAPEDVAEAMEREFRREVLKRGDK